MVLRRCGLCMAQGGVCTNCAAEKLESITSVVPCVVCKQGFSYAEHPFVAEGTVQDVDNPSQKTVGIRAPFVRTISDGPAAPAKKPFVSQVQKEVPPPPLKDPKYPVPVAPTPEIGVMDALLGITKQLAELQLNSKTVESKLEGMVSNTDLRNLRTSIVQNTKREIVHDVVPLKVDINDLQKRVQHIGNQKKVLELEMKIIHLSSPQTQNQNQDSERKLAVVFGGFDDWELDDAKKTD